MATQPSQIDYLEQLRMHTNRQGLPTVAERNHELEAFETRFVAGIDGVMAAPEAPVDHHANTLKQRVIAVGLGIIAVGTLAWSVAHGLDKDPITQKYKHSEQVDANK